MANSHDDQVSSNPFPNECASHQFYLEYNAFLKDAAAAYCKKNYALACKIYKQALSFIEGHRVLFSDGDEEMLLMYLTIACLTESESSDDLIEALTLATHFKNVHRMHVPAIYLLLAKIHKKCHRFKLAEDTINDAFALLNTDITIKPAFFPQTYDPINETNKSHLLKALMDLKEECSQWRPANAVCNYDECQNTYGTYQAKKEIFFSDPSFDGLITVLCSKLPTCCTFKYHPVCWKTYKTKLFNKAILTDEELIGQDCLETSCRAMIQLITLTGKDDQVISSTHSESIFSSMEKYIPTGAIKKQNGQHYNKETYRTNRTKTSPEIQPRDKYPDISVLQLEAINPELKWRKEVLEERRKINFGFFTHNDWRNFMRANLPNYFIDINPPGDSKLSLIQDFIQKTVRKNPSKSGEIQKTSEKIFCNDVSTRTDKGNGCEEKTISSYDNYPRKARSCENSLEVPDWEIEKAKIEVGSSDHLRKDRNENSKNGASNSSPMLENEVPTWNFSNCNNMVSFDPYPVHLTGKNPNSNQCKSNEQCLREIFTNSKDRKTEDASAPFSTVANSVTNSSNNPQEESSKNSRVEEKNNSIFNLDGFLQDLSKDNSIVLQKSETSTPRNGLLNSLHTSNTSSAKDTISSSLQETSKSDIKTECPNSYQITFEKLPTSAPETNSVSSSICNSNGLQGIKNENAMDQCETKFSRLSTFAPQDNPEKIFFFSECKSHSPTSDKEMNFNSYRQNFEQLIEVDEKTKNSINDSVAAFFKSMNGNNNINIPMKGDTNQFVAEEVSNSFVSSAGINKIPTHHSSNMTQVNNGNEKNDASSELLQSKLGDINVNNPFDHFYKLSLLQENNNKNQEDADEEMETAKSTLKRSATEVIACPSSKIKSKGINLRLPINFKDIRPPKDSILYKVPDTKTLKVANTASLIRNPAINEQESEKCDEHFDKNIEGLGNLKNETAHFEKSMVENTKAEPEQMNADAREINLTVNYDKLKQDFSSLQRQLYRIRQDKIDIEHNFEVLLKEKKKIENTLMEERQNFQKILTNTYKGDVNHKNTKFDKEIQVEDERFDFQEQFNFIQKELEATKKQLKDTIDTNLKLQNKASEFDAFKQTCFLMKKSYLKKNLTFQSLLNKSLIVRHIDQCNTAISIFDNINSILLRITGFSMPETSEWSATLNSLYFLNQFEQEEFTRLRAVIESQDSIESLAEIKLPTPVLPPVPKPGLGDFIYRALENLSKFHTANYSRIQSGVPLVQYPSMFNAVIPYNKLPHYPAITVPTWGNYVPQAPVPSRVLSSGVVRENVKTTNQTIQDHLKIEELENFKKATEKVMNSKANQNSNEKHEICGNEMIQKGNGEREEVGVAKKIGSDRSSKNEEPKNTDLTHNSDNVLKETSNNSKTTNSCLKKETKKNQKVKRIGIDQVLKLLRSKFSGVFELDLLESLSDVRKHHNNTLSGLYIQDIVNEAEQFIWKSQFLYLIDNKENNDVSEKNVQGTMKDARGSKVDCGKHSRSRTRHTSVSSTSSTSSVTQTMGIEVSNASVEKKTWGAVVAAPNETWDKKFAETECIICMEPMQRKTEKTYTLMCKHTFHSLCIHDWFKQNQSCPNCRMHSTLDDEFPPLPM